MRSQRINETAGRIGQLAAWQYGAIAHDQLVSCGLSVHVIYRWLESGRPHPLHRGVYLLGHAVPPRNAIEMGAVLACRPRAVISHRSAAYLWELLPYPASPRPIHVSVVGRTPRQRPGIVVHRLTELNGRDRTTRHRVPVTAPERTVIDLAGQVPLRALEAAVARGYASRRITESHLCEAIARAGIRAGVGRVKRLLDTQAGPALTRSEAEGRLLELIRRSDLPHPEVNARLGPYEVDFLWREACLVVEVDGYRFHSSRLAFERDRHRAAELHARGYRVTRVTWRQLVDEPEAVIARLGRALAPAV